MLETLFVRDTDEAHAPPCDVAHVPYRHQAYGDVYVGMVQGVHSPDGCVTFAHVTPDEALGWLASRGYVRAAVDDGP